MVLGYYDSLRINSVLHNDVYLKSLSIGVPSSSVWLDKSLIYVYFPFANLYIIVSIPKCFPPVFDGFPNKLFKHGADMRCYDVH